jgi:hypothetical protein
VAWRELSTCRHEPPVAHHNQILAARLAKRDEYLVQAQTARPQDAVQTEQVPEEA